jgi:pimeloyl-ACP methyl ester carboxylesterase
MALIMREIPQERYSMVVARGRVLRIAVRPGSGTPLLLCNGPRRGYYYQLLSAAGWTSLPLLPFLRQPTLILADDDPIIPLVNARLMHSIIPRNAFSIYKGGHLEMIANPKPIAIYVESFLSAPEGKTRP